MYASHITCYCICFPLLSQIIRFSKSRNHFIKTFLYSFLYATQGLSHSRCSIHSSRMNRFITYNGFIIFLKDTGFRVRQSWIGSYKFTSCVIMQKLLDKADTQFLISNPQKNFHDANHLTSLLTNEITLMKYLAHFLLYTMNRNSKCSLMFLSFWFLIRIK